MAFTETLRFRLEPGMTRAVVEAAGRECIPTSSYIRRALRMRMLGAASISHLFALMTNAPSLKGGRRDRNIRKSGTAGFRGRSSPGRVGQAGGAVRLRLPQ